MRGLWNNTKTVLLMSALMGLCLGVGYLIGGPRALLPAFLLGGVMNVVALFFSDKIALASVGAVPVAREQDPSLYRMVEDLTQQAGLPMPGIYVSPADAPNAFATGRSPSHSVVCVTAGLRRMLTDRELEGVIAHELSHIKNRDMLIGTVAAVVAGAIGMIAHLALFFGGGRRNDGEGNPLVGLLLLILAPIAATLIQLAVSRSREYEADRSAAELTGNPNGLASALGKLTAGSQRRPLPVADSMASLFIVTPLTGRSVSALFMTHPPIEKRIARLRSMPQNM